MWRWYFSHLFFHVVILDSLSYVACPNLILNIFSGHQPDSSPHPFVSPLALDQFPPSQPQPQTTINQKLCKKYVNPSCLSPSLNYAVYKPSLADDWLVGGSKYDSMVLKLTSPECQPHATAFLCQTFYHRCVKVTGRSEPVSE